MAGLTPLPPSVHHTTTRLTHLQAHTFLSNFLQTAENEAAYRPDSTLSDRGPVSASTGGGSVNLTLANLKRVLKGLEGKRVGGAHLKVDFDGETGASSKNKKRRRDDERDGYDGKAAGKRRRQQEEDNFGVDIENGETVIRAEENASEGSGWQEQGVFELEQDDENVDAMNEERDPGANLEQPENKEEEREMLEVEVENPGKKADTRTEEAPGAIKEKSRKDKDKQKQDKKARKKEEKAQREKERMAKKNG